MNELVRQHTALDDTDLEWLHLLVSEWQLLSDLSFADLVLWVPTRDGTRYVSVAQMRPNTGPTSYQDDMVGHLVPRGRRPMLDAALDEGRIVREGDPEWREEVPVRVESIPVRREGRVLGVIARNTNLLTVRTPSRLELTYLQSASDLAQMIAAGSFPFANQQLEMDASPRVGDGLIRLDADGVVQYASPTPCPPTTGWVWPPTWWAITSGRPPPNWPPRAGRWTRRWPRSPAAGRPASSRSSPTTG